MAQDFRGDSMAKTPPYNAGGEGLVPGQGTESPHASWPKK